MKTFLLALFVTIVVALAPAVSEAAKASAADPDSYLLYHCLTYHDYRTMSPGTLSQTEAKYDLTGYGKVVHVGSHGTVMIKQYRFCGYTEASAFFQITYVLDRAGHWQTYFISFWDFRDPLSHQPDPLR